MEERPIVRAIIIRSTPTTGIEYFLIEKQKKSGEWYATNVQGGLDGRSPVDAAVAELHEEIGIDNGYYFVQTQVEREYNTQREIIPMILLLQSYYGRLIETTIYFSTRNQLIIRNNVQVKF